MIKPIQFNPTQSNQIQLCSNILNEWHPYTHAPSFCTRASGPSPSLCMRPWMCKGLGVCMSIRHAPFPVPKARTLLPRSCGLASPIYVYTPFCPARKCSRTPLSREYSAAHTFACFPNTHSLLGTLPLDPHQKVPLSRQGVIKIPMTSPPSSPPACRETCNCSMEWHRCSGPVDNTSRTHTLCATLTTSCACGQRPANDPQLMTYRAYLDSFLLPAQPGVNAQSAEENSRLKDRRKLLKRQFTEAGEPGAMFR